MFRFSFNLPSFTLSTNQILGELVTPLKAWTKLCHVSKIGYATSSSIVFFSDIVAVYFGIFFLI